jgi:nuclear RNA export factor
MPKYLPGLVNLSLSNNNFRDKRDLNIMVPKPEKLPNLRELVLVGNPLREGAISGGLATTYRMDVLRRIPSLEVLDGEAIAKISFDAPQAGDNNAAVEAPRAKSFPFDMNPSFVTGVDSETMGGFLVRFFQAFDSDRNSLAAVYDPAATFSYSANTSIPSRARVAGFLHTMPNQKKLAWTPWIENGSRNLSRVLNDPVKMMADLHVGPDDIVRSFKTLPKTHHDITGPAEKFSLDAFPVPHGTSTGLLVIVHGQFTEVDIGGVRSFDRNFMVVPAPEGSRYVIKSNCFFMAFN